MAYCRNCGAPISDKAVICPRCGVAQSGSGEGLNDSGSLGWGVLSFFPAHCGPDSVSGLAAGKAQVRTGQRHRRPHWYRCQCDAVHRHTDFLCRGDNSGGNVCCRCVSHDIVALPLAAHFLRLPLQAGPLLFLRGRQFPVCARCTGMLLGFVLSAALYAVWHPPLIWGLLLLLPAMADGVIQLKTPYESCNRRRLWTGFLGGYGSMLLLIGSFALAYRLGMRAGFALLGA